MVSIFDLLSLSNELFMIMSCFAPYPFLYRFDRDLIFCPASLACRFNSSIDFQLKTFEHDVLCLLELEALVFHLHELFTIGGFARRL